MDMAYPDNDYYTQMDDRQFREHTAHLKPFFDALRLPFEAETITRAALLQFMRDYQSWFKCDDEE